MAVQTNAYGQTYSGNDDFRGWLAANGGLSFQADGTGANSIDGTGLLDFVGNDGKASATTSNQFLNNLRITAANNAYQQWLQGRTGPTVADKNAAAADAQAKVDEQAYWDDQIGNIDSQLGRLGGQQDIALGNADKSYQSAFDTLTGQEQKATRDYTTNRTNTIQDNTTAKSNIDTGVSNKLRSYQNLIRTSGSARDILAPYAAAVEGNNQRNQVQTTFTRNLGNLDTAHEDDERQFGDSFSDLINQRDTSKNSIKSGFASTEAQLLQQKGDAAIQKQQAGGASYTAARAARAPYADRINSLLATIDQLGITPTFTPKAVNPNKADVSAYTFDKTATPTAAAANGVNPGLVSNLGSYWTLLTGNDKDKKQLVAA